MSTHGKIWWSELATDDVKAACAFYQTLCGWQIETVPMGDGVMYNLAMVDGVPIAGIMDVADMPEADRPDLGWMTYIAVADIDATVAATVKAGGKVLSPPFEVPDTGRIAMLQDPTGATVGMMTPAEMG